MRHFFLAAALVLSAALVLAAGPASAQSLPGNFAPFNGWWVHPSLGTLGVDHDGTNVNIDRDGDGIAESAFSNTQVLAEARTNLRLSPTRERLYGWGGSCGVDGARIYLWSVPPAPSTTLTPIVSGPCVERVSGAPLPRFYDTGLCQDLMPGLLCTNLGVSPKRVAYILTGSSVAGELELVWVDLNDGTVSQTSNTAFRSNAGFIHVSPSGTQAFVQHDLGNPGETDYTLIDLCPGSLGVAINAGGFPVANSSEVLQAVTTDVSGGDVTVTAFDPGMNVQATFSLTDCCAPPQPLGACCRGDRACDPDVEEGVCSGVGDVWLEGDVCSSCVFPPITEACCFSNGACDDREASSCLAVDATPMGEGSMCSSTMCPVVDLFVEATGTMTVNEGDEITYTISYGNTGTATSLSPILGVVVPPNTTFVSASGNGDESGGFVTWALPDLAPGANGMQTLTVEAGCGLSLIQLLAFNVMLQDAAVNFVTASMNVDTAVDPLTTGPIDVAISSVPAAGPPVPLGELVTHTISLDNSLGENQAGLLLTDAQFPSAAGFAIGSGTSFEAVVDAGGGVFEQSGSQLSWRGTLPPGTTNLVFTTRIDACLDPNVAGSQLNAGQDLAVQSACDEVLGTGPVPAPLAIERAVIATLEAPALNPPGQLVSPLGELHVQLARPADTVAVQLRLASGTGQSLPDVDATISLEHFGPTTLVSPSEPGASYDSGSGEIHWNGSLPSSGEVVIATFETELVECRGTATLEGGSTAGCVDIGARLALAAVPEPPEESYLVALGTGTPPGGFLEDQILAFDPTADTAFSTQLCLPAEFLNGIGVGPGGEVWVGWLPTFHYNPRALTIQGFDYTQLPGLGLSSLADIAVDPRNGTVYFLGGGSDPMLGSYASVVRRDPISGALSQAVQDFDHFDYARGIVDELGDLVVSTIASDVLRIDGTDFRVEELETGETQPPRDVDLDLDGDYVTVLGSFSPPFPVIEIDSDGVLDPIVVDPNLAAAFPLASFGFGAVAVDPIDDSVYVAPFMSGLGVLERDASGMAISADEAVPFSQVVFTGQAKDMHFTPVPEPGVLALGATSLLVTALCARRMRARRPTS